MNNKYYNDAIIGNKNMRITFSKKGELLRLYYPRVDFKQFIDSYLVGIRVNDSNLIKLHEDVNNRYEQQYIEDTNILATNIENTYFKIKIRQVDYVMLKKNVLIKKYILKNNNKMDLDISFIVNSNLLTNNNNMFSAKVTENGLIQYSHDYVFATFSEQKINGHRINDIEDVLLSGVLEDKDYIGMSNNSGVSYSLGVIKPGEEKEFTIFILLQENCGSKIEETIKEIEKIDTQKEFNQVKRYWKKYLDTHNKIEIKGFSKETTEKMNQIYKRTILLFPLLQNEETGGIAATMEIDENFTKCGRYNYCWPRDAVFVTRAFDELNMSKEAEKFYKVFCKNTQSENGMWEQRFYTDGSLAPCWGYQIDETASVIYGVYEHYKKVKDKKFVTDSLKMCENAMQFLFKYLAFIFNEKEETDVVKKEILEQAIKDGKQKDETYKHTSYDIWEMNEGIHLYSLASIYAAFQAMLKIYDISKEKYKENRLRIEQIMKNSKKLTEESAQIKKYVSENLCDVEQKTLKRNIKDNKTDISILGAIVPFELFSPTEKKVVNTVQKINMTLRTYTGGYVRFEEDHYMQGINPWPIATLWMALYYIKCGDKKKAKECINFVTASCSELGFLGEQVDNNKMQPNWVIGLGWSHAMYIIAIKEYINMEEK